MRMDTYNMIRMSPPQTTPPCVLVLGMFDGVHQGHRALLDAGKTIAAQNNLPLCVCTFDPHPLEVLRPQQAPKRLTTSAEQACVMEKAGVHLLYVIPFRHEVAKEPPQLFLEQLQRAFRPVCVVCGFNYTFGFRGEGDGELLRTYGATHGFAVKIVPAVYLGNEPISSTRIRKALASGDIAEANHLLGSPYSLLATLDEVRETEPIRLRVPKEKALPCKGEYACRLPQMGAAETGRLVIGEHPQENGLLLHVAHRATLPADSPLWIEVLHPLDGTCS